MRVDRGFYDWLECGTAAIRAIPCSVTDLFINRFLLVLFYFNYFVECVDRALTDCSKCT